MGIIFSAVKATVPEAWELGKDYYGFVDLFPPCKFDLHANLADDIASAKDIPPEFRAILAALPKPGPRWEPGKPNLFKLTDLYPTVDDFISKMQEIKNGEISEFELPHWRGFYTWAGSDEIQIVGDFETWQNDAGQAHFCVEVKEYRWMDSWNGTMGRMVA